MGNELRVLFPFVGDTVGGSHISALTLVRGLQPYPAIMPLVLVHQDGLLEDYLKSMATRWEKAPSSPLVTSASVLRQILLMLRAAIPLSRYLRRNRIDIVHTNDMRMHLTWLLAARLGRARMVWHQRTPASAPRLAYYMRLADSVITISEYCRRNLPERISSRAQVTPSPVADPGVRPNQRGEHKRKILDELNMPRDGYVVGWVANFMERKRPLLYVDMAARLVEQYDGPVVFVMLGEPREPICGRVFEAIREQGLENRVFVMGFRTPVTSWIAGCDVLVATAVREGLGRTLIEAMMVGTPVVATADGGHVEIVETDLTGLLVPPDDPVALAVAVLSLIENPDRAAKLASAARVYAEQAYSVEHHVERVARIYESLQR